MRPLIIGLCGRAGSGKTSVASHLEKKYQAQRISFAYPLKKIVMDLFDFTEEQVFGEADIKEKIDPRWGISPRIAMQRLGQSAREHIDEEVWMRKVFETIGRQRGIFVIEDVRHLLEAAYISTRGRIFRLHCSDSISIMGDSAHPSEVEVDLIPKLHVYAEITSSRLQGLDHLFGLIDDLMMAIL